MTGETPSPLDPRKPLAILEMIVATRVPYPARCHCDPERHVRCLDHIDAENGRWAIAQVADLVEAAWHEVTAHPISHGDECECRLCAALVPFGRTEGAPVPPPGAARENTELVSYDELRAKLPNARGMRMADPGDAREETP